ncbi:sensor histidine kinase [Pedobacter insulae]|uniref:histidine kinase n=1 Tax=Pedobacter insulae TaxID=414048 RepID=A0A1I2WYU4_9SPHI|nr:HAMP domain-containing sensor histidine kinase [Pedobacter insulae]SFH06445.1 His Kinase A (phospho-acceptor) domain-containing protein [Pedobacter insulae]
MDAKNLNEQNEKMDYFVDVIHHLKTPFNHIKGLATLLEKSRTLTPEQVTYIELIKASAQSGLEMTTNLLDLNSHEINSSIKTELVELDNFVGDRILQFNPIALVKNIGFTINIEAKSICTDKGYLATIFDNLTCNAIKFSPADSTIGIQVIQSIEGIKISIKDQGPGFTEHDKTYLYHRFKKLSANPTGGETSNGLGLAIVKQLVDKLDGNIELNSIAGQGSEFIVTIPSHSIR